MKKHLIYGITLATLLSCGEFKSAESTGHKEAEIEVGNNGELQKQAKTLFGKLPAEAISDKNPLTPQKIALGKALYFEKALSKGYTQSCNTCHNLSTHGVDNSSFSKGNDGGMGDRNSPSTLNAALHVAQFWDGREPDVEAQAGGPILNTVEMAMPDEKFVIQRLSDIQKYRDLFSQAFPEEKEPITYANLRKAIGAFERKLITPSRFDNYLAGDDNALNDQEKEGLQVFIKTGCITCHSGSLLGGTSFQKFGVWDNYWNYTKSNKIDSGRYKVSHNAADLYVFKVPSLRNVEKTFPYFHDGSVDDLETAVDIMAKAQLGKELTKKEKDAIVLFLRTLTGNVPANMKE